MDRRPSPYFDGPLPRIIAHRGFAWTERGAARVVENTIPAFAAALALGASHLETDVHASSDGVAIVSHDPDLSRLLGREGLVSDHTASELSRLEVPLPSLAEVLAAFPATRFNIDIKAAEAVEPTVAAIRDAGAIDRVLVTSFSGARRNRAVRALPGVATSASALGFAIALLASKIGLVPVVRLALRRVDAVQVPERALRLRVTTPRLLAHLHAAGVEMHVWTVNDEAAIERLLELGVDGIITDRTDIAVRVQAIRAPRTGD